MATNRRSVVGTQHALRWDLASCIAGYEANSETVHQGNEVVVMWLLWCAVIILLLDLLVI